jgi:hypothetical protein
VHGVPAAELVLDGGAYLRALRNRGFDLREIEVVEVP